MEVIIIIALISVFVLSGLMRSNRDTKHPSQEAYPPTEPRPRPAPARPVVQPPKPAAPTPTHTSIITGKCYVIDGDTIVIKKTHIRLFGIDAPELNHPWGQKAKWEMIRMCKGQIITAQLDGSSSHDRVVATCTLPDGTDLSEEMVRRGLAIDWPKFSGGVYTPFELPGIRKKLWRCHNRQIGKYIPD